MSESFDDALALTQVKVDYANAIRSLRQAVINGDRFRQERDALAAEVVALNVNKARLAAVRVACDGAESECQHHITIEAIRAAMGVRA